MISFLNNSINFLFKFSLAMGGRFLRLLKELFLRLLDIIRYNPVFHKVTIASCVTTLFSGSFLLVLFAVVSPELPPENLFTTIKDVSGNEMNYPVSEVVLCSSGDNWVSLTLFDDKEFEKGSGSQTQDRTKDFEYPVRPGETLSEIAYVYDISYEFLAWYNNISNANRIRMGTVIIIPSYENVKIKETEYQQQRARQRQVTTAARTVRNVVITHESRNNGSSGLTVHFSIVNPPSELKSYEWDLGDGRRSFNDNPSHDYSQPKTYTVRLTAQDNAGNIYRSNPIYIDIPYPTSTVEYSTTKFVTLSSPNEYFVVNGTITKVERYANPEDILDLSESDRFLTKVRFNASGFFGVTVRDERGFEQYYSIFVSPVPSVHVDFMTNNFNWYRTQFNTGTPSNCGPASASMGISWATGKYFPVSAVRQAIGWQGNGGTSFDELLKVIKNQGVNASLQPLKSTQDIRNIIDAGGIAIVLFHTDGVRTARRDPATDLFGKYYDDSTGHYIVVKGYSLNGEYLVVHDPIPSDWGANSFRYADEISMMGRNRYFNANEVIRSLRRSEMIVIPGSN
ncbi:MAG: PKD domain-containing protein [Treponema sp.]|nr:PKD domain-containing protein [Treponema sp.]